MIRLNLDNGYIKSADLVRLKDKIDMNLFCLKSSFFEREDESKSKAITRMKIRIILICFSFVI